MDKTAIAQIFREISLLMELKGENPFKSRAYIMGAQALEGLTEDLAGLAEKKRLTEIPGIGKTLAENIEELLHGGSLSLYDQLRREIPPGLVELLKIPGLGPKKARMLFEGLNIAGLRELEYALKENRLLELPGFGEKTQERLLRGLEYLKANQGLYYYAEAWRVAQDILAALKNHPAIEKIDLTGDLRRSREVINTIGFLLAGDRPEIIEDFLLLPQIEKVQIKEETRAAATLQGSGLRVELEVVEREDYYSSLLYYTGSKEHYETLAQMARDKGWDFCRGKISRRGKPVSCRQEEDIYRELGLYYIPPELRENRGEIQWAAKKPVPRLLELKDIKGVFHVHTNRSDGRNTLEEMVQAAVALGYEYLGISDHSQSAFYAGGLKAEDLRRQKEEIVQLQAKYPQIALWAGVESDIKADGSLDYPEDVLAELDFVIASVHSHFHLGEKEQTRRILQALAHPQVTMLGHPTGRILLARPGYALDMEAVLEAAQRNKVIIELNASPARLDLDWRLLKKARERGILISINPDAHRTEELKDVFYGVAVARKGWLTKEDVFNCSPRSWLDQYLQERKTRE